MKEAAKSLLLSLARKVPAISSAAYYVYTNTAKTHKGSYLNYRDLFVQNGKQSVYDEMIRSQIAERFEEIDRRVPKATTPTDGLILAEALLSMGAAGDIVECGCFAGASSAKLSIIAQILGRRLLVFDSFEGLPEGGEPIVHARLRNEEFDGPWKSGDYSAGLDAVRGNVESFGEPSVCSYVQGWFNQTLTPGNLPEHISAAFTDVDLYSSARECLLGIWPRLSDQGIYFSHDVAFIPVLQQLCDENLWVEQLHCFPPVFFGAGFGICDLSPHLGYMVKGSPLAEDYLKSLTLNK